MRHVRPLCLLLVLVVLWQAVALLGLVNPMFLPSPAEVWDKARHLSREGRFLGDVAATLWRALAGFGLAFCLGAPGGLVVGASEKLFACFELPIDYFRSIPPVVAFPLALLLFGIGEASRIAVVAFGCLPILLVTVAAGVRSGPRLRRDVARCMGAGRLRLFWSVIVPGALPSIFVGTRVALSMAVIIAVVTEMLVGARFGLGGRVTAAQIAYDTPELYCDIIVVGLAGLAINKLCAALQARVVHWE
ncbi:ABC transporter permease [Solidesulfovibrio sp.]|uniref:ABC transporter permease n=1 Tax=Solidesulfovibrio sp. TaxID=2910990 RepID=UPI0026220A96|nr:ABC transporter permease [Solidesulfovibrio sp.]